MKKLFTTILVTALITSTFCGCGKKTNEVATTINVEPTEVVTEKTDIVEPTDETVTASVNDVTTETEEPTEETVDLSADEYLVDYPLVAGDQKVYIRIPENYSTFADTMDFWGDSYDDFYTSSNMVYLFPNTYTKTTPSSGSIYLEYSIKKSTDEWSGTWYMENKDNPDTDFEGLIGYDVETEVFDNGITLYTIKSIFDNYISNPSYFIEYPINDDEVIYVCVCNSTDYADGHFYADDCNNFIEFYRTVEDPFVIR